MYISKSSLFLLSTAAGVQALSFSDVSSAASVLKREAADLGSSLTNLIKQRDGGCPAVWQDVAAELKPWFLDGAVCSDDARAAIRLAFHDCFSGGCDGSIILAQEYNRPANNGLQAYSQKLAPLAEQFGVGMADLIQFSGGALTPASSNIKTEC